MNVLGIDYDAHGVYLALVDEDTAAFAGVWSIDLDGLDAFTRARRVPELLPSRSKLEEFHIVSAAIELPYSRHAGSLVTLMRVQGAILASLPTSLNVVEVRPQTWKKITVGKSNADKAAVRKWALAEGCSPGFKQDVYDAYCIGRAALVLEPLDAGEASPGNPGPVPAASPASSGSGVPTAAHPPTSASEPLADH